jgi:hypothetical protein
MSLFNKILGKPSGRGVGQAIGGTGEFYPLNGSLAFLRDDFSYGSLDTDEWDATSQPMTGTGTQYCSDGRYVVDIGTSATMTWAMTSKNSFKVPFRVITAVGVDGISTGHEAFIRVKDSAGTWLAEYQFIGSAGGTEHTAVTRVRAGSTAAGYISSASVDPSAVVGVAGSANIMYVIDCDYNAVTFAIATAGVTTSAIATTITPSPKIVAHHISPILKQDQVYYLEYAVRAGTAVEAAGAASTAANASGFIRIDFAQVIQYAPDAAFQQRQNPVQVYAATTGTGATAMLGFTQLKWS